MEKNTHDPIDDLKSATLAAVKAVAEDPEVTIEYVPRAQKLKEGYLSGKTIKLSHPSPNMDDDEIAKMRGDADRLALKLRHHNAKQFMQDAPSDMEAKQIFQALERARCESLGARQMRGVKKNIFDATEQNFVSKGYAEVDDKDNAPISEAVYVLARQHFSGQEIPPSAQNIVGLWQSWLELRETESAFMRLEENLEDQAAFAELAKSFIRQLNMLHTPGAEDEGAEEQEGENAKPDQAQENEQEEAPQEDQQSKEEPQPSQTIEKQELKADLADMGGDLDKQEMESQGEGEIPQESVQSEGSTSGEAHAPNYTIYTDQFDEIVRAEDLVELEELRRLREVLDHQLKSFQAIVAKLANRLQRKVLAKQQRGWEYNVDDGVLNPKRFASIVANPTTPVSYMKEKDIDFQDTIVTLLIDNSGSMRGRPISIAAISTDVLARTLERCGVKVEILGFTTRSWKGGKSRDLWLKNGRPGNVGRLNDLRHIIYKSADAPWRRARTHLGLMLKEGLLKENIDGEALLWAHKRLNARPEKRKIMMVISDGAPVDDSTLSVNSPGFLEQDLHNVIHWIEKKGVVELMALGIGHDVTRYYKHAITLSDAQDLAGAMITELTALFEKK